LPQILPALTNKGVDAALVYEPFVTLFTDSKAAVKWLALGDYYPDDITGFLVFGDQFIQQRSDVARRWMVAHLRGMRDFANFKKTGKDKDIITPIITKATGLSAGVVPRIQWPGINPDGFMNPDILLADQKQLLDWGSIKQTFPIDQLYDPQFVDYAVKQLGKAAG